MKAVHSPLEQFGSFRDPGGFVFSRENQIYRQINSCAREDYELLMSSGLYDQLCSDQLLIPHDEVAIDPERLDISYKVIRPEVIPYISYPYEWSFTQLRDAALLTLQLQTEALQYGLSLKDASAYNIQFLNGKPVFIDTLSFEKYPINRPWIAYSQFCRHFLAPLTLMSFVDLTLQQLLKVHLDGIPLDLCATLLPKRTRWYFGMISHIHLHAKSQKHFEQKADPTENHKVSKNALMALLDNLDKTITRLTFPKSATTWGDYYQDTNYSTRGMTSKTHYLTKFTSGLDISTAFDLGANDGRFSRLLSDHNINTIAFDIDPVAVEKNYISIKEKQEKHLLPLLTDLTNPSPALGWNNTERLSLRQRSQPDLVMALALIHHLAIVNNLPLDYILSWLASITKKYLILEFIPKTDSQVQRLLANRKDIFTGYNKAGLESAYSPYFTCLQKVTIDDSQRSLYLLSKK